MKRPERPQEAAVAATNTNGPVPPAPIKRKKTAQQQLILAAIDSDVNEKTAQKDTDQRGAVHVQPGKATPDNDVTKQVEQPPPQLHQQHHLSKGEDPVKCVAQLFGTFSTRNHLEIEGKLGKWIGNKFISGVRKTDFFRYVDMLSAYNGWDGSSTSQVWVCMFDYMLANNIRVTKTNLGNTFCKKTVLENVTFKAPGKPYDVRVSLKEEMPVQIRLPQEPHLVRVKKRRSFVFKGQWRFDMTIVWTGSDEQDAQSRDPTYEVECEYVAARQTAGPDLHYSALSLLEKMIDFLGRETPTELKRVQ